MTSPHTHEAFRPGAVVGGKYVVERQLAEGGIGVVVVATHVQLRQRVAIKYLQTKVLKNAALVERFKREAQLAASIGSDHVVRVFDVGTLDDGAPYMVMEYLDGEDLGSLVSRGPLPCPTAIDYVLQACDAIAEAHALGIVHRDLKPENLFLSRKGAGSAIVKILDFGISKASGGRSAGARLPRMTEDGERFGTPIYMSPEQLRSSTNVDARADIWGLGVVLFELLTGDIPFAGENVAQVTTSIQMGRVQPLRELLPDASPDLEAAILKCLEKDPKRRYRNVAELAQDLVPFGTNASRERLINIQRIVRGAGDSIRPPRLVEPSQDQFGMAPTLLRAQATLDAVSTSEPHQARWPRTALLGVAGAAVLSAGLLVASAVMVRPASGTTVAMGSQAPVLPSEEPFDESWRTATDASVAQSTTAPASATPRRATTETKATRGTAETKPPAPPSAPPVAVKARPAPPPPPPASGRLRKPAVDYSEFGERR